ncbi:MAG: AI-2E family transporter [Halodesulfurarchaeum sp.]
MVSPWEMDRGRAGWWIVAIVLGAILSYTLYSFIGTIVFGVFIYYSTRPLYRRLERFVRPPSLAAGVALLAIALPALLLLAYTIAIGIQELEAFIVSQGIVSTRIRELIEPYVDISSVVFDPSTLLSQPNSVELIRRTIEEAAKYLGFFGFAALHLFVMIVIAFFLLRDDQRLAEWFYARFGDEKGIVTTFAHRVDEDFSHIFFGNLLNGVLTGIIGAVSYGLLSFLVPAGLFFPYPTLLGLLSGIASLIPVVGIKLVYVPAAAYLGYQAITQPAALWFPILFVIVSFVVVDVIPDLVLRPYVSGRGLHLGLLMIAYVFGPLMFGWYGLFLGPMILVLLVHFTSLVLPELMAGVPIEAEEVDLDTVPEPEEPESEESKPGETPPNDGETRSSEPEGDPDRRPSSSS